MIKKRFIALVGCGNWGKHILRDLNALGCEVIVVARSSQSIERAQQGNAAAIVGDIADLPDIDGAVVAATTTERFALVDALLDRPIPIFVEKPLTIDPEQARHLAEKGRGRLFVMDKWRYHQGVLALAQLARSGEYGKIHGLDITRIGWGTPRGESDVIWHLTPHDISIAYEILGEIPPPAHAVVESQKGRPSSLFATLGVDPWVHLHISAHSPIFLRKVQVFFEGGLAILEGALSNEILVYEGAPPEQCKATPSEPRKIPFPEEMPLYKELEDFLGFINGGPPPKSTADEGAENTATIAALRKLAGIPDRAPVLC